MSDPVRRYDADGFRRVRPSERSPGLVELQLLNGRCIACVGFGAKVERAIVRKAQGLRAALPIHQQDDGNVE